VAAFVFTFCCHRCQQVLTLSDGQESSITAFQNAVLMVFAFADVILTSLKTALLASPGRLKGDANEMNQEGIVRALKIQQRRFMRSKFRSSTFSKKFIDTDFFGSESSCQNGKIPEHQKPEEKNKRSELMHQKTHRFGLPVQSIS